MLAYKFQNPEGHVARRIELLSSCDMKIEYIPGNVHKNVDGLSRIPCGQCGEVALVGCFVVLRPR